MLFNENRYQLFLKWQDTAEYTITSNIYGIVCFRVIYIDNVLTFVNDLEVICPGKKVKMSISIIDPYTT